MQPLNTDELLDIKTACEFLGGSKPINRVTLYRGIKDGRYPAPIHISPNTCRWLKSELQASIDAAVKARS